MSGFSWPLRIVFGTAFAALACGGRVGGNDTSSDDDEDGDDDRDDDGNDDADDDGNDDDGISSDPDGDDDDGDDDGQVTTDPDGDDGDGGDDDSTVSSDDGSNGEQDPLEGMGEVEMVAGGFAFAEGPVWVPELGAVLFTDIPADAILAFQPSTDATEIFVQGTGAYVNGLDLDALGNLLMCEGANRRVTRRSSIRNPITHTIFLLLSNTHTFSLSVNDNF